MPALICSVVEPAGLLVPPPSPSRRRQFLRNKTAGDQVVCEDSQFEFLCCACVRVDRMCACAQGPALMLTTFVYWWQRCQTTDRRALLKPAAVSCTGKPPLGGVDVQRKSAVQCGRRLSTVCCQRLLLRYFDLVRLVKIPAHRVEGRRKTWAGEKDALPHCLEERARFYLSRQMALSPAS